MNSIQWFPGHMHAARKKLAALLSEIDVVVQLLDARIPGASRNPLIGHLCQIRQKPLVTLLNKADLADPSRTALWVHSLRSEENSAVFPLIAHDPKSARRLLTAAAQLAPHRMTSLKPLRLAVVGIPNVGKSTLFNTLCGRKSAKVADEPAVTRGIQRYDLSPTTILYDTPGLLWPKIDDPLDSWRLAACHAIGRNALEPREVAEVLFTILLNEGYGDRLQQRYGLTGDLALLSSDGFFEQIARRYGCLARGSTPDHTKAALLFLQDFRTGKLGPITLETPPTHADCRGLFYS